jgi:hypothetical protein
VLEYIHCQNTQILKLISLWSFHGCDRFSISFAYDRSTSFILKTLRAISFLHLKPYQPTFILWLVMKDRLLTGDRLIKMGYKGNVQCIYCHNSKWDIKVMFNVYIVITRLKAGSTFFLNAALAIEFGSSL